MKYLLVFLCVLLFSCRKEDANLTLKVDQACAEAKSVMPENPGKAQEIANSALRMAEQNDYKKGVADALATLGMACFSQGQYGMSTEYYIKGVQIRQQLGDQKGLAQLYYLLGIAYQNCLLYRYGEEALQNGLEIQEQDTESKAKINRALGAIYKREDKYQLAEQHYKVSLALFQSVHSSYTGFVYNDLAILKELGSESDYTSALELYQKAFSVKKKYGLQGTDLGRTVLNIGRMYFRLDDTKQALVYINQAKEYCKNNPEDLISVLNEEAEILLNISRAKEAKQVLSKAELFIPSLVGIQKQDAIQTYKLSQVAYGSDSDKLRTFRKKEAQVEAEVRELKKSANIEQLEEKTKAYHIKTVTLEDIIYQLKQTKNQLYWAMAGIFALLILLLYSFLKYRRLFRLFREYVKGRDKVMNTFI